MKIDHIALYVSNLERAKEFWCKYFEATANALYYNEKTGLKSYFLSFKTGCKLEIMNRPDIEVGEKMNMHSGYTHLAISVGSKVKVDNLTEVLRRDGYVVLSGPRLTGDGYYESCVLDFENNQIEITE